ncbi:MAG TPA: hypothetical protein VOA78_06865 [Candidatus Dormibacteraeota bacterium]|nr:hypothetical protein [Candidatus Dormibacteraeota bacterium]
MIRRLVRLTLLGTLLVLVPALPAQEAGNAAVDRVHGRPQEMIDRVVANQRKNEQALDLYERIERVEVRKTGRDALPAGVKISRVIPAGTGTGKIPVGPDGKAADAEAYRAELEKVVKALTWAAEDGRAQREAYEKIAKKRKDKEELIDATRRAFVYTFEGEERRGEALLHKYRIEPNPLFKPASRVQAIFTKVRGHVWIDEVSRQLARVEGDITDDFSVGLFLGKIYKGSHFMQERYEIAPGVWLPTFSQYDFDGRKLFSSFAIHERTFYSKYRLIGPPKEALVALRSELSKAGSAVSDP